MTKVKSSEITPESLYLNRRKFMVGVGGIILSTAGFPGCDNYKTTYEPSKGGVLPDDKLTSYKDITTYNNFYEFSLDKEDVIFAAKDFKTSPWKLEIGGLTKKSLSIDVDDLTKIYDQEERIYRFRCVEGWSMVIPWLGLPLARLLKEVEPLPEAKYVQFMTLHSPSRMPNQKSRSFPWPYIEGLRIDEAMHDLTFLSTGLYGKKLMPQNGAPIRLVVPWKYGFKSIKSIVRIILVEHMPASLWMKVNPREYGFYSNVNPAVDHPRWSQASERRIGEFGRRETLPFNGYEEDVADLYKGMDLKKYF